MPATLAVACVVEAAGVAASVLWPSAVGAVVAALLLGGTFMGITVLGLQAAREVAGADGRRALAAMTAVFGLGQIVGPALAGLLHGGGGFALPSLLAAAALLAAACVVLSPKGHHAAPHVSGGRG